MFAPFTFLCHSMLAQHGFNARLNRIMVRHQNQIQQQTLKCDSAKPTLRDEAPLPLKAISPKGYATRSHKSVKLLPIALQYLLMSPFLRVYIHHFGQATYQLIH
ncbi:MAG: hypothetical protein F6K26_57805 [Moorea sp. SIO2I5]|nr:hypothetical protein [Moorena sp. SIO2I5]